ncbi:MAG: hypothetical protein LH481_09285 [Burkholderiales bacterium]|nr:hypothetical protein [Burkholderiales bacterium]
MKSAVTAVNAVTPATSVRGTSSTQALAQNFQGYKSNSADGQGKGWRQTTMTKAELQASPIYWMLAYSESDMAWLSRHGYPSIEEEAMLSKTSIENLKALADGGDLNASIHLGLRHSKNAITTGDAASFRAARNELDRALIGGGPYQSAKTIAFFAELANDPRSHGEMSATTVKEIERHLLQYHDIARGLSSLFGDSVIERVGNGLSSDLGRVFGLPPKPQMSFEMAMRQFSNINASRVQRGLPPFALERRPSEPGGFQFQENNVVYSR